MKNNPLEEIDMPVFCAPLDDMECDIALDDAERQRCEVWTRVMGYHRPAASFNTGKKGEFQERLHFREARDGPRH